jgi:hypothetical protein
MSAATAFQRKAGVQITWMGRFDDGAAERLRDRWAKARSGVPAARRGRRSRDVHGVLLSEGDQRASCARARPVLAGLQERYIKTLKGQVRGRDSCCHRTVTVPERAAQGRLSF